MKISRNVRLSFSPQESLFSRSILHKKRARQRIAFDRYALKRGRPSFFSSRARTRARARREKRAREGKLFKSRSKKNDTRARESLSGKTKRTPHRKSRARRLLADSYSHTHTHTYTTNNIKWRKIRRTIAKTRRRTRTAPPRRFQRRFVCSVFVSS